MIIRIMVAILALVVPCSVLAESRTFFGVGLSGFSLEDESGEYSEDESGATFKAGVGFTDYIAIEASAGFSEGDMDYLASVLAKPILPLTDSARVYGLLGASRIKVDESDEGPAALAAQGESSSSNSESGTSLGVGAEVSVTRNSSATLEYVEHLREEDFDVTALTVGIRTRF